MPTVWSSIIKYTDHIWQLHDGEEFGATAATSTTLSHIAEKMEAALTQAGWKEIFWLIASNCPLKHIDKSIYIYIKLLIYTYLCQYKSKQIEISNIYIYKYIQAE